MNNCNNICWSTLMLERLTELHGQQLSFGTIARTLNAEFNVSLTRNAVIGKARRHGFPPRPHIIKVFSKRVTPTLPRPAEGPVPLPRPRPPQEPVPPPPPGGVLLIDLRGNACHFLIGEAPHRYCGHANAKGSYCARHYAIVYVPARGR